MDPQPPIKAAPTAWLRTSVLEPHVSAYCSYLCSWRYATNTIRTYVLCIAHFARWMGRKRISLASMDESVIRRFMVRHLPQCDCPDPVRRWPSDIRAALRHLLIVLRASGAVPNRPRHQNPLQIEVSRFGRYMEQVLGLAPSTRKQRVHIVHRFLLQQFGSGPIAISRVKSTEVLQFVTGQKARIRAGSMNVLRSTLRCYFRFRVLSGDHVQSLMGAVPSTANWRLAPLPDVFSEQEIQKFLRSFRELSCSPKRAYAMARCLADLGLRASEVARLHLEDIDWHNGTVRLAANKSRRVDVLPLPMKTGRAIAEYLCSERPHTKNRAVFVRHVAPYDKPIGAGVVQRHVREAYRRCGWTHSRVHILRHSVASRLLQAGTSLKDIADLLRHRSLDTSAIYTKVNRKQLAAVALPWLGRTS